MTRERVDDIIALLGTVSPDGAAFIRHASAFAEEKHRGHVRLSGEPYYTHLFETARELAELGMEPTTIAAGFLHDCIEDANATPEELQKEFGSEVLFLVQGVSKLGTLRYQGAQRHAESLRRLFVATSQDMRVLIIKLMDRLHNMRTLEHVRPDKRIRIATETLEIYAPIADRLGMGRLKRTLEDLAFLHVNPEAYAAMEQLVKERGVDREAHLVELQKELAAELVRQGVTSFRTEYRVKGLYSLYTKLARKGNDIEQVHDILAIRVIVNTVAECYHALGIVHSLWRPLPGKIKDFIAFPKPNGYRSIHTTVITKSVGVVEVQLRSEEMHRVAQYGIASHISYKQYGDTASPGVRRGNAIWFRYLIPSLLRTRTEKEKNGTIANMKYVPAWIKEISEAHSPANQVSDVFIEGLKNDFFSYRVFVFTPKGDVVDLPLDSSPVDFAFSIHSDIGLRMSGAKVNGKMAPLDTKLQNGDIVEIITKPAGQPTKKWLDYAKTTLARRHITAHLQKSSGG